MDGVSASKLNQATFESFNAYGSTSLITDTSTFSKLSIFNGEHVVVVDTDNFEQKEDEAIFDVECPKQTPQATSTVAMAVANLMKNLIGGGMCSLPQAFSEASLVSGLAVLFLSMIWTCTGFITIAYLCDKLGADTYRELWAKTLGKRSSILVDMSIFLNCSIAALAVVILVCDLLEKSVPGVFGIEMPSRSNLTCLFTLLFLLPVCHMKKLTPFKYTSMLGLAITAYVFFFVVWDAWEQRRDHHLDDNFVKADSKMMLALGIYISCFKAHYNAPVYYKELGRDLSALTKVSVISFSSTFFVYAIFAFGGYARFGTAAEGNVLKSYDQGRFPVICMWLGMAFSNLCTYPLIFYSARNSLLSILSRPLAKLQEPSSISVWVITTSFLVLSISFASLHITDVSLVVGFLGSTIGSALCLTMPAAFYLKNAYDSEVSIQSCLPVAYQASMFVLGIFLTITGAPLVIFNAVQGKAVGH